MVVATQKEEIDKQNRLIEQVSAAILVSPMAAISSYPLRLLLTLSVLCILFSPSVDFL